MSYKFSAIIEKENNWYIALCPELDVASQGKTIEEAINNLKEAVTLYLQTASKEEIEESLLTATSPLMTTLEVTI